jgi:cardiolipin synthase
MVKYIPTFLTVLRIACIPFLLHSFSTYIWTLSFYLLFFLFFLDVLDGYIARRYNVVSHVGAFLDSLADKILIASLLLFLWHKNIVDGWYIILIIIKECILVSYGLYGYIKNKKVFFAHAQVWGKIGMVIVSMHTIILFIMYYYISLSLNIPYYIYYINTICMISSLVASYSALFLYINFFNSLKKYIILFIFFTVTCEDKKQIKNEEIFNESVIVIEEDSIADDSKENNDKIVKKKKLNKKKNINDLREEVSFFLFDLVSCAQKTLDKLIKKSHNEREMFMVKRHDLLKVNNVLSWAIKHAKNLFDDPSSFSREELDEILLQAYNDMSVLETILNNK